MKIRGACIHTLAAAWSLAAGAAAPLHAGANFWTSLGPNGGAVTAVLPDPFDASVVYAGTTGGGVFKSADGGATWQQASRGLSELAITGLAADPQRAGALYATSYDHLAVSRDAAATWNTIPLPAIKGIPQGNLLSVAVDPALQDTLYLGTSFTVWVSPDGGSHWTASKDFRRKQILVVADPVHLSVFALFPDADADPPQLDLFETTNGGATWIDRGANLPPGLGFEFGDNVLAVEPDPPGTLWLASRAAGTAGRTWRSTDGGASWQTTPGTFPVAAGAGGLVIAGERRSLDGGATWQPAGALAEPASVLAIAADGSRIYGGSPTLGTSASGDAARTWQVSNQGLTATQIATMAINPRRPAVLYAPVSDSGILKTSNGGATWQPIGPPFPITPYASTTLVLDPAFPSTLYLVASPGTPFARTTDAGATWSAIPPLQGQCVNVASLAPDPVASSILYATGALGQGSDCADFKPDCTAFKSGDGGASWSCMESPDAFRIVVAPSLRSTLYGLGSFGAGDSFLWKSLNSGSTWSPIGAGLPVYAIFPVPAQSVAVDPTNSRRLFVGGNDGSIWRSLDGGAHWQETDRAISHGLALPVLLAIDPKNPQLVYAARDDVGVYRSLDGGNTWRPILAGLPPLLLGNVFFSNSYFALVPDPQHSGTVYLATFGRGILAYTAQ